MPILKIWNSSLPIPGYDTYFFPLRTIPGWPGWYSPWMAAQPKGGLEIQI